MNWMLVVWVIVLVVSLAALVKSADWFTEGAEELGVYLGVPPYVVGLTIVSMGTSLPELATSVLAALRGQGIGRVLLLRCLAEMRAKGFHCAWFLWTGQNAARLYERVGFHTVRRFAVMRYVFDKMTQ